ncbi:sodium/hydrogen exchanger family protein [Sarocladium strictum]
MPILNPSELNVVVSVLGGFMILYGWISVKIKQKWYLGEALPAMALGIFLGPMAAKFLEVNKWGSPDPAQISEITLGITRIVISVQLVIVGYQLPAQYHYRRWKDLFMCLIPIMTLMWIFTTLCIMATIPNLSFLATLVVASCVTCTDPILSQAVAKGPFADKYVPRHLREIISAEAGVNDGFGFPFMMLAVYLLRFASGKTDLAPAEGGRGGHDLLLLARAAGEEVGRQGGGAGEALKQWFIETWIYYCLMGAVYGAVVGTGWRYAIKYALKWRLMRDEFYVLFPAALGLFLAGTSGVLGTNDLIACAAAGHALNWDGEYLLEIERRHDEVNESIDVLLNFGGFMYIGAIIPWSDFHDPDGTGITLGRLFGMAFMVFIFRRIPAILMGYKFMPRAVADWREALFMGYFGPIGIGAVFYVEHARHVIPKEGEADEELNNLVKAMGPCIYFLVVFSIIGHGLSTPLLALIYSRLGVKPIQDDATQIRRVSMHQAAPPNSVHEGDRFVAYNRFSRPASVADDLSLSRSNTLQLLQRPFDAMQQEYIIASQTPHPQPSHHIPRPLTRTPPTPASELARHLSPDPRKRKGAERHIAAP